jgi:hypothetical protein
MSAVAASRSVPVARLEGHTSHSARAQRAFRGCTPRFSKFSSPKCAVSSSDESTETEALNVWAGGGSGVIAPADTAQLKELERRWNVCDYLDMQTRWQITKELWHSERTRCGLSGERWKLGWTHAKTYVGICHFWDDDDGGGYEKGDVFLSKYLLLDPEFNNVLGCVRHELAHALTGPGDLHHGEQWRSTAKRIGTQKNWSGDTAVGYFYRPAVLVIWSAHDLSQMLPTKTAHELPPEQNEKTVWPGDGTRTVFADGDGDVVM